MSANPRVLAVITARGGSKRIPKKNIRLLAGKPLIAWSIEAALAATDRLYRLVVSTDDIGIADIARHHGAEVPFLRPPELSGDQAKSLPVLQHAVRFIEERDRKTMDWILLLQPTSPLRTAEDIVKSIDLAVANECDSVVSVCELEHHHPVFAKKLDEHGYIKPFLIDEPEGLRRQDVTPTAYMRNGAIYLTRRSVLMEQGSIYGSRIYPYIMPAERSVDIDTEIDFRLAEILLTDTAPRSV